jgi:RNA polymerase sigma-70 factor (ECF subfamily)
VRWRSNQVPVRIVYRPVTVRAARFVSAAPPEIVSAADGREAPQVASLVAAARAGDREAFGALVSLNQRAVYRAAYAALGTREDAEDVAQEAFVVAWQKLGGFRGDATFRTWLLTIVWHRALDRRRSRRAWWRRLRTPGDDGAGALDQWAGHEPDPERRTVAADLADRARREIARLSPRLRDTLLLAASGQYAYDEIAAMLRVPVGTVKWRVAEARRIVRRQLPDAAATERQD